MNVEQGLYSVLLLIVGIQAALSLKCLGEKISVACIDLSKQEHKIRLYPSDLLEKVKKKCALYNEISEKCIDLRLVHDSNRYLFDGKTLEENGIKDGDTFKVQRIQGAEYNLTFLDKLRIFTGLI